MIITICGGADGGDNVKIIPILFFSSGKRRAAEIGESCMLQLVRLLCSIARAIDFLLSVSQTTTLIYDNYNY